jgi:diguanylate cyclase (GGDEF)-like protein
VSKIQNRMTVADGNRVEIVKFTIEPESLAEITRILGADGSRLLLLAEPCARRAQIFTYGVQPKTTNPLEKERLWQDLLYDGATEWHETAIADRRSRTVEFFTPDRFCQIERIAQQPLLAQLSEAFAVVGIESLSILPLRYARQCVGCLTLFRSTPSPIGDYGWTIEESNLAQSLAMQLYLNVMQRRVKQMFGDRVYYDLLTGLPNRLFLHQQLTLELAKMQSTDRVLAVILLDLDRFKNINDSLGHGFGDRLLQLIAERLQQEIAPPAIVGRWSGDEFMLLIPDLDNVAVVSAIADRILHCFDRSFVFSQNFPRLKTNAVRVKVSMGIAIATGGDVDLESLLRDADIALGRAKQNGKNNYQIYTQTTASRSIDTFQLENMLYRAIDDRQLILHYQPQIELKTGRVVGIESLLRCQGLDDREIGPDLFIPIAEETGSILPIGEWVLRTACQQNKLWQEMGVGHFPIAINFSLGQLQDCNSIERIIDILAETNLSPSYLEIEITEGTAIDDLPLTISILTELQKIGVKISLDDFGTGYSSLAALKYLPIDRLKIDRLFIQQLKADTVDAMIVKTIVNLGRELKLQTIAEGVETIEQLDFLRSIDCDAVQGFLFSRPLPAADLQPSIVKGYWRER